MNKIHKRLLTLLVFVITVIAGVSLSSGRLLAIDSSDNNNPTAMLKFAKLQAFKACLDQHQLKPRIGNDDNGLFGSNDSISVGYIIDPGPEGNGNRACNNMTGAHLGSIGTNRNEFLLEFYQREDKNDSSSTWVLKEGKDVQKSIKDKVNSELEKNKINNMTIYSNMKLHFDYCYKTSSNTNGTTAISVVDLNTGEPKEVYLSSNNGLDPDDTIGVGYGMPSDDGKDGEYSCQELANYMNNSGVNDTISNIVRELAKQNIKVDTSTPAGSSGDSGSTTDDSCESAGEAMSWIMCPVIKMLDGTLNWADSQIQGLLQIDENKYSGNPELKSAWTQIRNLAYIILVPIMLVMVVGTAIGSQYVDAYTVKKAFPRMVAAVIFIAVSWFFCVFLIDFFNVLGTGIMGIVTSPFSRVSQGNGDLITLSNIFQSSGGQNAAINTGGLLAGLGTVVFGATGGLLTIMSFLFTASMAMLIGLIVLLIRQMFVIALLLLAPLAILAWIFPGNDKLWKLWWGSFSKLLMMFPLIMLLLGVGRVFAIIILDSASSNVESGLIAPLMALTAYVAPYLLIPSTFKFAGGAFANLAGMANDRSRGLFDRQKKFRQGRNQEQWGRIRQGNAFRGANSDTLRGKFNTTAERLTNPQLSGSSWNPKTRADQKSARLAEQAFEHAMEASEKIPGAKSFFASDTLMMAGLRGKGDATETRNYLMSKDAGSLTGESLRLATQQVLNMRSQMGDEAFTLASLAKLPSTGTAYVGDKIGEWHRDIAAATHGNTSLQASLIAAGKSGFRSAQRYEVSEAGFGDHLDAVKKAGIAINKKQDVDIAGITADIVDSAYKGGGGAAVVGSRNADSARMFAGAMNRSLDRAISEGNEAEILQAKAGIANVHDQLGGAKLVVSDVIGKEVMGREIGTITTRRGTGKPDDYGNEIMITTESEVSGTVLNHVDASRGDSKFQQFRKEYTQAERAAKGDGGAPTPGETPPPAVGGGLPG